MWLLKPGELALKGANRKNFESALKNNLSRMLGAEENKIKIRTTNGRYFVECANEKSQIVENALCRLIGISGWAKTTVCEKKLDAIISACVEEAKKFEKRGIKTFKIIARRTDKSFPFDSYKLCCLAGDAVLEAVKSLSVKIKEPDDVINIEIREKAYVYSGGEKGLGGLPVGTAGKGLLLLSGGIDSPVAGFLMSCRGMKIDAIHFHAYPYTSNEAKQKAVDLCEILGSYCVGIKLYIINFMQVQMKIKERSPEKWLTVLLRMAMMEAAQKAAEKTNCKCLITGESLSQVASQTIENLSCTQSRSKLPVLRPLIGFNKENIIKESVRIGAYDISIRPYEDCCVLFNPPHPVLYGDTAEANALYETLEIEKLIDEALQNYELVKCR